MQKIFKIKNFITLVFLVSGIILLSQGSQNIFSLPLTTTESNTLSLIRTTSSQTITSSTVIKGEYVVVTRIIDGDTIEIEGGQKVRYIGINTPEIHHPTKKIECFGAEAVRRNEELVLHKKVRLVKDVSETDRYQRLLRYVYLADGTFVNLELVDEGYAYVDTFPPDVKYVEVFTKAMEEARNQKRGLWNSCKK